MPCPLRSHLLLPSLVFCLITANAAPINPYSWGESEPLAWNEQPDLPAARLEDNLYAPTADAWQLDNFFDDSPMEGNLASLPVIYGAYILPTTLPEFVTPDAESYEASWLEYLRQNQIKYGLIPAPEPVALTAETFTPQSAPTTIETPVLMQELAFPLPPPAAQLAAEAPVPEISSLASLGIGAAMLALTRLGRRRKS